MISVYIHIPFCDNICSYCDFAKIFYQEKMVDNYLNELENEIKQNYKKEVVKTLYIGGGTPSSLNIEQLKKLISIIKLFNLDTNCETTMEFNIENISLEKLLIIKPYINRISIGVQSINPNLLETLNRHHTKDEVIKKVNLIKELGFKNISIDLIYAIPNETIEDVKNDLDMFLKLDINHISTYSLMIEPNTILSINNVKPIDEEKDAQMYEYICKTLKDNGFKHYEISNFAKPGYESKHNLTYWNNEEYYGFGLGASGYIKDTRYTNTRSINNYLKHNYLYEQENLSLKDKMIYEMILGLRKLDGVNIEHFKNKFKKDIESVFNIKDLIKNNKLIKTENIYINEKYLYVSNDILSNFVEGGLDE